MTSCRLPAGRLVPQSQDQVGVVGVDLDEQVGRTGADHLRRLGERLRRPGQDFDPVGDGQRSLVEAVG